MTAVYIASNMVKYVGEQHYAKSTHFEALQPLLNRVMQGSERLTVLIFCDGEGKISGTPYDDAINQAFQEKLAEQKKCPPAICHSLAVATRPICRLHHGIAAAAGEISRVPAVAIATPAAGANPDQSAAARADDRQPAAHHHRQKPPGQRAAAGHECGTLRSCRKPVPIQRQHRGSNQHNRNATCIQWSQNC